MEEAYTMILKYKRDMLFCEQKFRKLFNTRILGNTQNQAASRSALHKMKSLCFLTVWSVLSQSLVETTVVITMFITQKNNW